MEAGKRECNTSIDLAIFNEQESRHLHHLHVLEERQATVVLIAVHPRKHHRVRYSPRSASPRPPSDAAASHREGIGQVDAHIVERLVKGQRLASGFTDGTLAIFDSRDPCSSILSCISKSKVHKAAGIVKISWVPPELYRFTDCAAGSEKHINILAFCNHFFSSGAFSGFLCLASVWFLGFCRFTVEVC